MNILEFIFLKKTSYEISQENLKNIGEMVSTTDFRDQNERNNLSSI